MIDKEQAIKLLAGTIARGLLWVVSAAAGYFGVEKMSQDSVTGLASFAAAIVVAVLTTWWSSRKNKKLIKQEPPKE